MKRDLVRRTLCCLSLMLAASGCAQLPWTKSADPSVPPPAAAAKGKAGEVSAPKNPLALARLAERRGQIEQAERLYQDAIKQTPNNPVPYHRLAVMYAQRGKFEDAEKQFTRALALKPDDPELLSDAGYCYFLASRPQDAERYLRRAVEIEPANSHYCNNLALVLGEQHRDDECLALFRRASSAKQANVNYAFVLAQRGEYQRALDMYDRVLTEDRSMRVAADAMIELSQRAERQPPRPPAPPADGRPMMAASSAPYYPGQPYATPQGMSMPGRPQGMDYADPAGRNPAMASSYPGTMSPNPAGPVAYGYHPMPAQPAPYGSMGQVIPTGYTAPVPNGSPYTSYPSPPVPNRPQNAAYPSPPNYGGYPGPQPAYATADAGPAAAGLAGPSAMPATWTPAPVIRPYNAYAPSAIPQRSALPDDYSPMMAQPTPPQYR